MIKLIKLALENKLKALWVLLCAIGICYFDNYSDLQFILFSWMLFPTWVLYQCEKRNISHKWAWTVSNLLLPWIAIWVFILLKGGKLKRKS